MSASVKVEIRYLSALRDRVGRRQETILLRPGNTLADVAGWLNERYGLSLPSPELMATLNGSGWEQLPLGLATEVSDGDVITLFPPISGG
jgi:MoaD family protein